MNVVVSGANRGMGFAFVKELLKDKSVKNVFALHRDTADTKSLRALKDSRLHVLETDLLYDDEIARTVEEVEAIVGKEGVDILINNAAVMYDYDLTGNVLRKLMCNQMEINAASTVILTQSFLPLIRKSVSMGKKGVIVNVTGDKASLTLHQPTLLPADTLYRMSKTAMNMFSRSLGVHLKGDGIVVLSMCPGTKVRTEIGQGERSDHTAEESAERMIPSILHTVNLSHAAQFVDRHMKPIPF